MTAERDSMTLNEVSYSAPRAGRARPTPDPEVVAKPKRRQFGAEYRLRILEEAERCTRRGEVGRVLRREGLYSSHLTAWRKARRKGSLRELAAKKRGAKPAERNPLDAKVRALEAKVARLEHELHTAHAILDVQGKVAGLHRRLHEAAPRHRAAVGTRSASAKPGAGSSQSENVRTGMLRRTDDCGRPPAPGPCAATGRWSPRSWPAVRRGSPARALDGRAAPSPPPVWASALSGACRRSGPTPPREPPARRGPRRRRCARPAFPSARRRVAHERRTRIACLRWKPVTTSNSSRIRVFSARVPTAYLRASAPTSSSRAVVLILLIPVFLEPIRWGAFQMRQRTTPRERFG